MTAKHADDAVLDMFEAAFKAVPGLEDHVVTDEEKVGKMEELPWCWLQLGDSDILSQDLSGKKQRSVQVLADILTAGHFNAMRGANLIAARLEDRIDKDPTLGRTVDIASLQGVTRARNDDASVARVRLTFLVNYSTARGAAEIPG